jgi:hypothetical protein
MRGKSTLITIACAGAALVAGTALGHARENQRNHFRVLLDGYQEVVPVSTPARGMLVLQIAPDEQSIGYALRYDGLQGAVTQAHIHFGRPAINGNIVLWLCGTAGFPGPAGTPTCPSSGSVSGTLDAADVQATTQGIAAGELAEVIEALRNRSGYGNVHSSLFGGGEIRGNLR